MLNFGASKPRVRGGPGPPGPPPGSAPVLHFRLVTYQFDFPMRSWPVINWLDSSSIILVTRY